MVAVVIQFEDGNAAFEDWSTEVARIVAEVADHIDYGERSGSVSDYNGNTVGKWSIT